MVGKTAGLRRVSRTRHLPARPHLHRVRGCNNLVPNLGEGARNEVIAAFCFRKNAFGAHDAPESCNDPVPKDIVKARNEVVEAFQDIGEAPKEVVEAFCFDNLAQSLDKEALNPLLSASQPTAPVKNTGFAPSWCKKPSRLRIHAHAVQRLKIRVACRVCSFAAHRAALPIMKWPDARILLVNAQGGLRRRSGMMTLIHHAFRRLIRPAPPAQDAPPSPVHAPLRRANAVPPRVQLRLPARHGRTSAFHASARVPHAGATANDSRLPAGDGDGRALRCTGRVGGRAGCALVRAMVELGRESGGRATEPARYGFANSALLCARSIASSRATWPRLTSSSRH